MASTPWTDWIIDVARDRTQVTGHRATSRWSCEYGPSSWHSTFEFTTDDGHAQQCHATTDEPGVFAEREPLVYDPAWPHHATLLGHLPGRPTSTRTAPSSCAAGREGESRAWF